VPPAYVEQIEFEAIAHFEQNHLDLQQRVLVIVQPTGITV